VCISSMTRVYVINNMYSVRKKIEPLNILQLEGTQRVHVSVK